ncbi:enoyl-CoA hydratase/isomerase family protein [Streptomyces sp. CB03238]|uniref:enoyl-CoA hydratase/isomerase family protein n=1 Tax=Streptomyces sp. CB03238 TaxID=1907777 RepID=UPI000A1004E8|nr:enoyl-CoA hydratase/isomerase family protein [Streptomyces sp. CB03238]ORT59115.1 hypothetical protein BKD26_13925 [Streptomyces sp. CB03238]
MADLVLLETRGAVAVVTLNRPDAGNALDHAMLTELREVTERLVRTPELCGVLLTGAGKDFCRGGDLLEMRERLEDPSVDSAAYSDELTGLLSAAVRNLRALPCPVIGAVNGQAAGAGMSLALACDLRIVSRKAVFHFAYGAIGASTDGGMAWFLPRIVGYARALELLLEQPMIRPRAALDMGLVSAVTEPGELLDTALRRLEVLADAAPHSIRSAKRLLDSSLDSSLEEHLAEESGMFAAGAVSADLRTGIGALLAGGSPEFVGR